MRNTAAKRPKLGLFYLDHVLQFFARSNFKKWPDRIEIVTYHWKGDEERFIKEVKKKGIDFLIGNVPATAYHTFLEIQKQLPHVSFIPSLESQFCNRSKENVTRFCWQNNLPTPETHIFSDHQEGIEYLKKCSYPRIIKRSYGPSNYGGYYVHKVESAKEAESLVQEKRYSPVYVQECIELEADIRVMLIGHQPVCAFWRRPRNGEWRTNTSQGGSMDYQDVPKSVLDLAIRSSQVSGAEYWGVDIAVSKGRYAILECATAFAAFPYIRDWIGGYLSWKLSNGEIPAPRIPLYNWEELGKIDPRLLRTMRDINFGYPMPNSGG
ncbi:MAG: hypothetical protein HQL69_20995 [Magnetococcales bacterium]|nr:hypothetical protein [Magnetococcales bacterium]